MLRTAYRWMPIAALAALAIGGLPVGGQAEAAPLATATELPGGGLMIAPHPALGIESMEVSLRPDRVRVVYLIRNLEERSRSFSMSFALPDLDMHAIGQQRVTLPRLDPANFVGAAIEVDGEPVEASVEQRALALGLDVSEQLQALDLPLFPYAPGLAERLAGMSGERRRQLEEQGLVLVEEERVEPIWTVKTMRHWKQEFRGGATLRVQLTYTPVLGSAVLAAENVPQLARSHCLDAAKTSQWLTPRPGGGAPVRALQITYLLGAALVQPGPVKKFRLTVEKPPEALAVALCRDGMKTSPGGALEWEGHDFWPDDDVSVLFLQ